MRFERGITRLERAAVPIINNPKIAPTPVGTLVRFTRVRIRTQSRFFRFPPRLNHARNGGGVRCAWKLSFVL